jgi:hypothetical protein
LPLKKLSLVVLKKIKYFIAFLFFITSALSLGAQGLFHGYEINSSLIIPDCKPDKWTPNSFDCCSIDVQKFENDSIYYEGTWHPEVYTILKKDTLIIHSKIGREQALGVLIYKDSCLVIYSNLELIMDMPFNDTVMKIKINDRMPCLKKSLKLLQKPKFVKGEIIEGVIEFKSKEFFYM